MKCSVYITTAVIYILLPSLVMADLRSNPSELLPRLFNESTESAELSDFDKNTDRSSNQECQGIKADDDVLHPFYIRRVLLTIRQDDGGPLFPGKQEYRLIGGMDRSEFEKVQRGDPETLRPWSTSAVKVKKTSSHLLQTMLQDFEGYRRVIESSVEVKRSGDFLVIKIHSESLRPNIVWVDSTPWYIYCYRR